MEKIAFCDGYLSELELNVPASHKLVYLFVTLFRGCTKPEIVRGLGLDRKSVSRALKSLQALGLVEVDSKGSCRLPKAETLPLERFAGRELAPPGIGGL